MGRGRHGALASYLKKETHQGWNTPCLAKYLLLLDIQFSQEHQNIDKIILEAIKRDKKYHRMHPVSSSRILRSLFTSPI